MHSKASASATTPQMVPRVAKCLLKPIAVILRTGDPAATVDRFFKSPHVEDLRLIIAGGLFGLLLVLCVGLPLSAENVVVNNWAQLKSHHSIWTYARLFFSASSNFLAFFAPVLAVFGALLAWAYQVGSARLGVVDLFACEISTLCRVTVVVDAARRCVGMFEQVPVTESAGPGESAEPGRSYTSQEEYFPVFEGNNRDLQTLEARVVINITAFYTFMKALRDSMRALVEIRPQAGQADSVSNGKLAARWHDAARNVVYMLFLAMESARHAIDDLIEFEPEKMECMIVVLLSELEAFRFLSAQFTDVQDVRHARITLRGPEYKDLVPRLCRFVEAGRKSEQSVKPAAELDEPQPLSQWEPAWRLLPELRKRFQAAIEPANP